MDATGRRFGDWPQFLDESLKRYRDNSRSNDFRGVDTNEDRIKYILESKILEKADWVQMYFDNCETEETGSAAKTSLRAECHRKEGNARFQKKQYQHALGCYNEAMLHAPGKWSGDSEMALCLGNRSAVLFHLQHYKESLSDIELAMRHGYPKHLSYKLLQRRALCYIQLRDTTQATQVLDEALKCVDAAADMDAKKKERLLKDIKSVLDNIQCKASENSSKQVEETETVLPDKTPVPICGWSKHVLQASDAVRIASTKDMGRHIVVNRQIKAGDILIVDTPFAAVLLPEYYAMHCHHCFASLLVVVPCHVCTHVRYCSEACRKESWEVYHYVECHHASLLYSVGIAHLSLRVILTAGLEFLYDFREKIQDFPRDANGQLTGFSEQGIYERQYLSTYALQDHAEDFHSDDLFQYSLTATLLVKCLQYSHCVLTDSVYIGGLLLRHICQLVCNAHAITKIQVNDDNGVMSSLVSTTTQVRIATAIYSTTSLTNHSCDPNVILGFDKKVLVVRATEDIPPHGSVFVSYGPTSARMGWAERQQRLREQYFFTCCCKACKSGGRMEENTSVIKCPHCSGTLENKRPKSSCLQCKRVTDTSHQRELLSRADNDFVAGLQLLEKNNVRGAMTRFHECLGARKAVLSGQQRSLGEVWDVLARCYAMQGCISLLKSQNNGSSFWSAPSGWLDMCLVHCLPGCYSESSVYLQHSVINTEAVYGSTSVELAHELQKMAEVLFHCEDRVLDAVQTADRAMELFTLNYGPECEAVTELIQLKTCLVEDSLQH